MVLTEHSPLQKLPPKSDLSLQERRGVRAAQVSRQLWILLTSSSEVQGEKKGGFKAVHAKFVHHHHRQ